MGTYTNQGAGGAGVGGVPFDPERASDRRRKVERGLADLILARAEHLPKADRELLRTLFGEGRSAIDVAPMLDTTPRRVRARARRLTRRVLSDLYLFVLQRRDSWPVACRRIATAVILHGLSFREAADALRLTVYTVRRHYDAVTALYEASGRSGCADAPRRSLAPHPDQHALSAAG